MIILDKTHIVCFLALLVVPFHSLSPLVFGSAEDFSPEDFGCDDKDVRAFEVASACEALTNSEDGSDYCPDYCETMIERYYEDCDAEIGDLVFLVITTDNDACFPIAFDYFQKQRGSDCETNRQAFRPMWSVLCMSECTDECAKLVDGVCTHCLGALEASEASSVEFELSISAPHCPQSTCNLGSGDGGDESSSSTNTSSGDETSASEDGSVSLPESGASRSLLWLSVASTCIVSFSGFL